MLADELDFVVGVDPHRDSHTLGVLEVRTGAVVYEATVAADSGGYAGCIHERFCAYTCPQEARCGIRF